MSDEKKVPEDVEALLEEESINDLKKAQKFDLPCKIRNMEEADIGAIQRLCERVYVGMAPWSEEQLKQQLKNFPEGQLVAEEIDSGELRGYSASLIISWDDYDLQTNWKEFTDSGCFSNHDPEGRTLYVAETMVDPASQGSGVGRQIYEARRALCQTFALLRIRAGARPRNYHKFKDEMTVQEYVKKVTLGEVYDPTLGFQLKQGFQILGVVEDYLPYDKETDGHAAVIEWLNPEIALPENIVRQQLSPYYIKDFKLKVPRE